MRTRTRKIFRDLWARKTRTLLAAVSIFIGVFGVVALSSAGEILINQLEKDLQPDKLAMLRTSVTLNREVEIDNMAVLNKLREQAGVTAVEARAVYPLFWRLEEEEGFREGKIAAHSEPFDQSQLEPMRLIAGRFPEHIAPTGEIELAIERRLADEFGVGVGDQLVLRVLSGAAGREVQTALGNIVGIIFQPYTYSTLGPVEPDTLVFAAYEDAAYLAGFRGYNTVYARFVDYATAETQQTAFINTLAGNGYISTYTTVQDPMQNPAIESTRTTRNLLVVLAMAALVVSGFLIINIVNAIVVEQRRQIGLLKALGANTFDTYVIYLGMAFMYGVLGVVPGVLVGLPSGYFFAQGLAIQSQTIIEEFSVSPIGLMLGMTVGLGIPVLAAILPVFNGTRVGILAAMTDYGIDANFGRGRLDRMIGNLPLPIQIQQAVRNAYQKRGRLALTGLTLTVACAAFMGIFAVFSSLVTFVDNAFETFGNEIEISPNEGQSFETVRALLEENVAGIESIDPAASLAIEIEGFDPPPVQAGPPGLFASGFNTENPSLVNLDLVAGTAWDNDATRSGVVISTTIAEALNKTAGDRLVLSGAGNRQEFEIIGVANFPIDTVWMNWAELARFGGLVDASGAPYPNNISVSLVDEEPTARQVDEVINEINETLLANGISSSFTNQVELVELITTIVSVFGFILGAAAFLIALVGAVGLLMALSMSVFERQKEIGVMRSVGAGSWIIALQFLVEGVIVGMVAWVLSVPLSYAFGQGLIGALPFGGDYEIDFPLTALGVGLMGMLGIVAAASLLPSLAAARKTVSDILRYQ